MTGHERKHDACRADFGVCVSGYTYISRVTSLQNVCRGSVEGCNQAHADACPQNQAQDRQARDRRTEAALPGYLYVLESSVWVCGKSAYKLTLQIKLLLHDHACTCTGLAFTESCVDHHTAYAFATRLCAGIGCWAIGLLGYCCCAISLMAYCSCCSESCNSILLTLLRMLSLLVWRASFLFCI